MSFYISFIFLILFLTASVIHLYASYKCNKLLRARTKGFIVSALLLWYICSIPNFSWFVVVALFFSWLGDILLIPAGIKWFAAGGCTFGISHLLFVFCYSQNIVWSQISILTCIGVAVIYTITTLIIFYYLKPHIPHSILINMFVYFLVNATNNVFAFYQMITVKNPGSVVCFIGALLFFISDATLFFVRFNKNFILKSHFVVMLTYILAEFLIVLGLILI